MTGKGFSELLQATPQKPKTSGGDDLGACASCGESRGTPGLYVLNGKENTRAFQYMHMGFADYSADGTSFVVEFNEPEKWRLTVKGRKLWKVFVNLHQHALEWIRKADRDFEEGNGPVVTEISIKRVAEGGNEPGEEG